MKTLACRESGMDCDFVARGKTDQEVLAMAAEHAKKAHGMKEADFTPDKVQKIRSFIHEEKSGMQQPHA